MTHVRQVTGTIHKPDGSPWPDFAIGFDVPKTAATTHATLPGTSVGASTTAHTIVTQTNASGEFAVDLEVDVTIRVTMLGALVTSGTSTRYPGESQFVIVVPDGDTPISLETIRAAAITPPDDPTLPNLVAQVASDLSDHEGHTDNPHSVTAAQAGTYTSGEIDNALSGKADTGDVPTELTDLDTTVTGAQLDALKQAADQHGDIVTHNADEFATAAQGDKADTAVQPGDLGSAAYTDATAYATAEQGGKADTALQPAALNDYETATQLNARDTANRSRANHTGTQAISTVDGLQGALDGKAATNHTHGAGDITSGTLNDARIPNLAADKITSGTFADARIPSLAISKTTGLQGALDDKLATADAPELIRDTMGTALVAGDNITITPDDAGDTITIASPAGAPYNATRPGQSNTRWMGTVSHGGGIQSTATGQGASFLRGSRFDLARAMRIVEMGIEITATGTATLIRLGIGTLDMATETLTMVHDAGTVPATAPGLVSVETDVVLPPGRYMLVSSGDGTATMRLITPLVGFWYEEWRARPAVALVFSGGGADPFAASYGGAFWWGAESWAPQILVRGEDV